MKKRKENHTDTRRRSGIYTDPVRGGYRCAPSSRDDHGDGIPTTAVPAVRAQLRGTDGKVGAALADGGGTVAWVGERGGDVGEGEVGIGYEGDGGCGVSWVGGDEGCWGGAGAYCAVGERNRGLATGHDLSYTESHVYNMFLGM